MKRAVCNVIMSALAFGLAATPALALPSYNDVLLVINDKAPSSVEIGAYFKNARQIPDINVVHVSMTDPQGAGNEAGQATKDEKKTLADAIKSHMAANKLADKINYIVLTRGIPMYAASPEFASANATYHLTDVYVLFGLSESAADYSIPDIFSRNKYFYYYNPDILNKEFSSKKFGYYIVSRLDGAGMNNIKKMIDDTGVPAYVSYKQNGGKAKFLTLHQHVSAMVKNELKRRNIELVQVPANPTTRQLTATMDTVAKDLMFAFFNNVVNAGYGYEDLPVDNHFYADNYMVDQYPFIYRGATFSPGSFATCFRSHPSRMMNRANGGLLAINTDTAQITDYQKAYDGSDIKFRHQTCVAYDPVNNQIWCGTGEPALNVTMGFWSIFGTAEVFREHMRNEGGGIAVYDAAGNILNWMNSANSPLKNNRVVKMVYDKASKLMWVMHCKGVQYYDLAGKTWHDVPALQNDFAAGCSICLDPYDSDKVYFSFYYNDDYDYGDIRISSQFAGAPTSIFEYSKSAQTMKAYAVDTDSAVMGGAPQMVKASADTLWVTKGFTTEGRDTSARKIALIRYDLSKKEIVEKIILGDLVPEVKTPPADLKSIVIQPPYALAAGPNNTILAPVGCQITYTAPRTSQDGKTTYTKEFKNYLIRVTEKSGTASPVEVINDPVMNGIVADAAFYARSLIADPQDSSKIYMALSLTTGSSPVMLAKSTDGGTTWAKLSNSSKFLNVYDLTINNKTIYAVRGDQEYQNLLCDFMAFGLNAFGGGVVHDNMIYNPSRTTPRDPGFPEYARGSGDIYAATKDSISWITAYLDTQGNVYGTWSSLKTYKFGDSVTDGAWVYVSAKDNNTGNPLNPPWQVVDISNISDYSSAVAYGAYAFVRYNGNVYFSTMNNNTYTPGSGIGIYVWHQVDISNIGDYSSSAQYNYNDLVQYNGVYYMARQVTTGSTPGVEYWQKTTTTVTTDKAPISQAEPMMFLYTDGFNMGETRFATQSQYPQEGGGGWTGHFLMFDPKCAPFAPRVDEENLKSQVIGKTTIEIPLFSPGLPPEVDGFIPETINANTVKITDETGKPVALSKMEYNAVSRKIVLTGDLSGMVYQVTLKCGIDGIKNIRGASLVNPRADEYKDEIAYAFGDGILVNPEIYTPTSTVGPVQMPQNNSKCDLSVDKVWWDKPPVAGQPLTVKYRISNVGTAKTNVAAGDLVAKVYLNNIKMDMVTFGNLAPKASVTLSSTINGGFITAGKQTTIMVWADAKSKLLETREGNNINSATFFLDNRPDLKVTAITLSSTKAGKVTVNFTIANAGVGPTGAGAGAQTAAVYVNGSPAGTVNYDDLAKGATVALKLNNVTTTAGTCKVRVVADSTGKVTEANENNNILEKVFVIAK
ncbi:MAG: CARDB domain-containing protein [Victivallaceae bacterium]